MIIDKADLINMIKGTDPGFELLDNELVKRCGYFTGGFVDKWTWESDKMKKLTEAELETLYLLLKKLQKEDEEFERKLLIHIGDNT